MKAPPGRRQVVGDDDGKRVDPGQLGGLQPDVAGQDHPLGSDDQGHGPNVFMDLATRRVSAAL